MNGFILCALCVLCGDSPARGRGVLVDRVDVVEVNHFYDENGRHVFDQLIFWDWCDATCRHQIVAWRLLKVPSQVPQPDRRLGGYVATWLDGDRFRQVRSLSIRETWTQLDPELPERQQLPKERRRELGR